MYVGERNSRIVAPMTVAAPMRLMTPRTQSGAVASLAVSTLPRSPTMLSQTKNAAEPLSGASPNRVTSHAPTNRSHRPADQEERQRAPEAPAHRPGAELRPRAHSDDQTTR